MLIIFLLTIVVTMGSYFCKCGVGCLKCSSTDMCLFCDIGNNYILQSGTCIRSFSPNCIRPNQNGTCKECSYGYYMSIDQSCTPVSVFLKNCEIMLNSTDCKYCEKEFYLSEKACTRVTFKVDGCKYYAFDGVCQVCEKNHYRFFDGTLCIFLSPNSTCIAYSQVSCFECQSGFRHNQNGYFDLIKNQDWDSLNELMLLVKTKSLNFIFPVCQKSSMSNCTDWRDDGQCLKCQDGFYLSENECKRRVYWDSPHCASFRRDGKCLECDQSAEMVDEQCLLKGPIPFCVVYMSRSLSASPFCLECQEKYFSNFGVCERRMKSRNIVQCKVLEKSSDACSECSKGFQVTSDKLRCLKSVFMCSKYRPSDVSTSVLECEECSFGHFFDENLKICKQSTDSSCRRFARESRLCAECNEGHYLNGDGVCVEQVFKKTVVCAKWSALTANECLECPDNHVLFSVGNFCLPFEIQIEDCQHYESRTTCRECRFPKVVSSDKSSCKDPPSPNCLSLDSFERCSSCKEYFDQRFKTTLPTYLDMDFQCQYPYLSEFVHCEELSLRSDRISCKACASHHYPVVLSSFRTTCLPKNSHQLSSVNPTAFQNCLIFSLVDNSCLTCVEGLLLANGVCVSACPIGLSIYGQMVERDLVRNWLYLKKRNYCDVPLVANCARFETSVHPLNQNTFGDLFQGCVECSPGHMAVIEVPLTTDTHSGLAHSYTDRPTSSSPLNRFAFIKKCVDSSAVSANLLPGASVDNCKYLLEIPDPNPLNPTLYGCHTCAFGFTGVPTDYSTPSQLTVIPSCLPMVECSTQSFYSGLGSLENQLKPRTSKAFGLPLEIYVSCHVCVDPKKTVGFEMSFGGNRLAGNSKVHGSLSPWDIRTPSLPLYFVSLSSQTVCLEVKSSWMLPSNCGLVMFDSDRDLNGYSEVMRQPNQLTNIFCMGCVIGFAASTNSEGFVVACSKISDCSVFEWNGCRVCRKGFSFGYDRNLNRIDNSRCLSPVRPNCYAAYVDENNRFKCKICNPGFVVSEEGYCDLVSISDCTHYTVYNPVVFPDLSIEGRSNIDWLIHLNPKLCSGCLQGQLVVKESSSPVCVRNDYLLDKNVTSSSRFPKNCVWFNMDQREVMGCSKCHHNYTLFNNTCYSANFTNNSTVCDVYDTEKSRCLSCPDGFFLYFGYCFSGIIDKCKSYESIDLCRECVAGHTVVAINPKRSICVNTRTQSNCLEVDPAALAKGEFLCTKCPVDNYISDTVSEIPSSMCLSVSAVINCSKMNILFSFLNSTFDCLACDYPFFVDESFCMVQTFVSNCAVYHPRQKRCLQCESGFVLSPSGQRCDLALPILGELPNCLSFYGRKKCLECMSGFYLKNNACVSTEDVSKIENCLTYNFDGMCNECIEGFYSNGTHCQKAVAKNCKEYESLRSCLTCPLGYGLDNNSVERSCVRMKMPNCTLPDSQSVYPFECLQCNNASFVDPITKHCLPVKSPIQFCLVYSSAKNCRLCEAGLSLSPDEEYCFGSADLSNSIDKNCRNTKLLETPMCNVCGKGFYFQDNECRQCQSNFPSSGCMFCNPDDNDECLLCDQGFYMDMNGICVSNPGTPVLIPG